MLNDRRRSGASQNTVGTSNLLRSVENIKGNVENLRGQLETDRKSRLVVDERKLKLLIKEEKSLDDLKTATIDFRKILGVAAGASAVRQFSQGNVAGGLQDTGVAITAFLPEIIGITQNVIVGGLAARGLLGGGRGIGAAGMARGGRAGMLALPLLALAPLLMGAGRRNNNNQSNAPTAEFRREQSTRRIRKDTIAANDTLRFGAQLDRFDRILSSLGKKDGDREQDLPFNLNQELEDDEPERNMNDKLTSFLELLDPLKGTKDIFEDLFGEKTDIEKAKEVENRNRDLGLGGLLDFTRNILGLGKKEVSQNEVNKDDNDTSGFEAGAASPITEADLERERLLDEQEKDTKKGGEEQPFATLKERLKNISESLKIGDDNTIDFSGVVKDTEKATTLSTTVSNFLNFIEDDFIPNTDKDKLEKGANKIMGNVLRNVPQVKEEVLENAPPTIKTLFSPLFNNDGKLDLPENVRANFRESDKAVDDVFVDPSFKKNADKFVNCLIMGVCEND